MAIIGVESEVFQEIKSSLEAINNRLTAKEKEPKEKWLDNQEVMQMLHLSKRTIQSYRDSGVISFSQIGAKIYYRESDINALLEKHYHKAHKK